MGTIYNNDCCCFGEQDTSNYIINQPNQVDSAGFSSSNPLQLKEKDKTHYNSDAKTTDNTILNPTKKQIVVILVAAKSFYSNQILVDEHFEYEVSRFFVVEQMKITAKELKPKSIFNAISNSNKNYNFLHQGFCIFMKGDHPSPLYKKMELIDSESEIFLTPQNLYYIFATNFDDMIKEQNTGNSLLSSSLKDPKFKKLNTNWKKVGRKSKSKNATTSGREDSSSDYSEINQNQRESGINNLPASKITDKKIGIQQVNDRRTRYSILNSMHTIKEVDSFNTSAFNVTLNTNNIFSAQFSNNNSVLNTGNNQSSNTQAKNNQILNDDGQPINRVLGDDDNDNKNKDEDDNIIKIETNGNNVDEEDIMD